MSDTPQFFDIVIFAMIAVFLGLRLRAVLGRRDSAAPAAPPPDSVIDLSTRRRIGAEASTDPLSDGLARIAASDPAFNREQFLQGAGMAFEMIVKAFAAGDEATLRPLLSDKVFEDFSAAIRARNTEGPDQRMALLRVVSVTLAEASLTAGLAEIAVRFVSEQKGADGAEVRLIDLWRFARPVGSKDPNWRLVATGSLDE